MNDVQLPDQITGHNLNLLSSLGDLPQAIWRHRWYVFASIIATLALGFAYLLFATRVYIAQARVVIERKELPLQDRPFHGGDEFLATQVEVIRSPEVLHGVMVSLGLPKPPDEGPSSFSQTIRRVVRALKQFVSPSPEVDPEIAAMTQMLQSLTVNPVLGTNVLNIGYRCSDPDQANHVVQAIIDAYRTYAQEIDRDAHAETLRLLKLSEEKLRDEASKLEQQYQELHKDSPLLGQGKDGSSIQHEFLIRLGQKLTETKSRRIDLENQLQALAARSLRQDRPAPTPDGLKSADPIMSPQRSDQVPLIQPAIRRISHSDAGWPEITTDGDSALAGDVAKIQDQLWQAQVHQKELAQYFGPKHAEIRALGEQITVLENLLRQSLNAAATPLEQELVAVKLNETHLEELSHSEFEKTKALDDYILKEQHMADDLRRAETEHESILTKLRQWELDDQVLATGKGGVTAHVIEDPANSLPRKIWPRSILVLAACLAFGFVGGAGVASILDHIGSKRCLTSDQ